MSENLKFIDFPLLYAFLLRTNFTSPRRKARFGLSFLKLKLVARLLLSPKVLRLSGTPKSRPCFLGKRKSNALSVCFATIAKRKRCLLCFDAVRLRVTQTCGLVQFVRSEAFFPIPAIKGCKKPGFLHPFPNLMYPIGGIQCFLVRKKIL